MLYNITIYNYAQKNPHYLFNSNYESGSQQAKRMQDVTTASWVSKCCIMGAGWDSGLTCSLQKGMSTTNPQNM